MNFKTPNRFFALPKPIADLVSARNALKDHYTKRLQMRGSPVGLAFTFDGNLVGDLGEALAVESFGMVLESRKATQGIDGFCGGTSVQVKATVTKRGPAFRNTAVRADHLLFFEIDLENLQAELVFNGPESIAFDMLPEGFKGQRSLSNGQIRNADLKVRDVDRLPLLA